MGISIAPVPPTAGLPRFAGELVSPPAFNRTALRVFFPKPLTSPERFETAHRKALRAAFFGDMGEPATEDFSSMRALEFPPA